MCIRDRPPPFRRTIPLHTWRGATALRGGRPPLPPTRPLVAAWVAGKDRDPATAESPQRGARGVEPWPT
eukprot:12485421-Alexandrium_andersonii.AAC.1